MMFNALEMSFRELKLRKDPNCPICSDHPTVTHLIDYDAFCGVGRGNEEAETLGRQRRNHRHRTEAEDGPGRQVHA